MPPKWTAQQYIEWSARLAGHAKKTARSMAGDAIEKLRLGPDAAQPLRTAPPQVRRAVVVAAMATGAEALFLDDPLGALPDDVARALARFLVAALEGHAWIVFAGRAPLSSPLALHADEAIIVSGPSVIAQGAPAEIASRESAYALRVLGRTQAFADRMTARGAKVETNGGAQLTVDFGEEATMTTRDLLAVAEETGAVVLSFAPWPGRSHDAQHACG